MTQSRLVGGRYELGELIGYGGMAEVHRGRDTRLGRDVAIKVLRADLARDPSFLTRFRREAQAAAGLNHPAIVAVYDTGEDVTADGTSIPFIVMEFVEGRTLREILRTEGRLPARRAMEVVAEVCAALDFSHRNGLVHRDIKPANVMITRSGAVKVMDFGIARAVADNAATVTQTANVIGTAQYLSPEQARGETVDGRSDVYSTGCLLYELVTGAPPFQGDSPVAVAYQHVRENPATPSSRVPGLPRPLESIVMKALAKNQLNRYQSAGEMRSDLMRALQDQPVTAETVMTDAERTQFIRTTPPAAPVRAAAFEDDQERRNGWLWAAIVVALLVVLGGAIAAFLLLRDSGSQQPAQVAVPNLIGMTPDKAEQAIAGRQLSLAPAAPATTAGPCDNGSSAAAGTICKLLQGKQTVGTTVAAGSTLRYQLFQPGKVSVPNVVGVKANDAEDQLVGANLGYEQKPYNSAAEAGTVEKQSPAPYTQVARGRKVTLYVSTGKVKLKDVVGQPVDKAVADLNRLQFTNVDTSQTQQTSAKQKDGTVAAESPTPGTAYAPGTTITLVIYKYVPPPPPTTSAPPTTSPPPSGSPSSSPKPSGSPSGSSSRTGGSGGGQGVIPPVSSASTTVPVSSGSPPSNQNNL